MKRFQRREEGDVLGIAHVPVVAVGSEIVGRHGERGMLVVGLQQRLPRLRVVDREVLREELPHEVLSGRIDQERLLARGEGHVLGDVKADRRGEVHAVLWCGEVMMYLLVKRVSQGNRKQGVV